jgi:hypothetical protein
MPEAAVAELAAIRQLLGGILAALALLVCLLAWK